MIVPRRWPITVSAAVLCGSARYHAVGKRMGDRGEVLVGMETDNQGLVVVEETLDGQYKTSVLPGTTGYYWVIPHNIWQYLNL